MDSTEEHLNHLSLGERLVSDLLNLRQETIREIEQNSLSLTIYLIEILRESLLQRAIEIAQGALLLYRQGLIVPAFMITRACIENTSMLHMLKTKTTGVNVSNIHGLQEYLEKAVWGSKNDDTDVEALNILKSVDKMSKLLPHIRQSYDSLSEFAHPNYAGVVASYGRNIGPNFTAIITPSCDDLPPFGLGILIADLVAHLNLDKKIRENCDHLRMQKWQVGPNI